MIIKDDTSQSIRSIVAVVDEVVDDDRQDDDVNPHGYGRLGHLRNDLVGECVVIL